MEPRNGNHLRNENEKIKRINIPYVPRQVYFCDLDESGRLVSVATLKNVIKSNLLDTDYPRTRKQVFKNSKGDVPKFSIIYAEDSYYSIYKGNRHGRLLGKGGFGSVKLAQNIKTGEWVALKVMDSQKTEAGSLHAEIANLKNTDNYFYDYARRGKKGHQYELLMKLASGTCLYDLIVRNQIPSRIDKLKIAIACLKSIQALHKKNILHRDIKPENLVYDTEKGVISIVDFGLAIQGSNCSSYEFVGTEGFYAPEQNSSNNTPIPYNEKTEVYALGVTLCDLFNIPKNNPAILFNNEDPILKTISKMLMRDPEERSDIKSAIFELTFELGKLLGNMPTIRNFTILNVDDYQKNQHEFKTQLLNITKSPDNVMLEISLINDTSSNLNLVDYAEIKISLVEKGFMVSDQVYLFPPITARNLPDSVASLINDKAEKHCFPAQIYYLHHNDDKVKVTEYNDLPGYHTCKNEVIRAINQEKKRLEGRIKTAIVGKEILTERLEFLERTLIIIESKAKPVELNCILKIVDGILKNMKPAFPLGAKVKTLFTGQSGPDGRKAFEELKGEIQEAINKNKGFNSK